MPLVLLQYHQMAKFEKNSHGNLHKSLELDLKVLRVRLKHQENPRKIQEKSRKIPKAAANVKGKEKFKKKCIENCQAFINCLTNSI